MKALILVADGVEDLEFFYPYYRLQEEGIEVDVAAPEAGTITGKHGYTFDVKLSMSAMKHDDYDLLILPGGKAPETVRHHPNATAAAKTMLQNGKVVAAICHGAQTLISAKVLKGRTATCWQGIRDDIKAAGAKYVDEEVVVDDNLITSRSPDDLPAFCREIFKQVQVASQ
ncbi:MAG: type 1 glutamine amidotransferase [Phycisphaerae bacterium]|nr:type 1 glutamine amidotransferase [Phycisphaerae bacterium]